MKFFHDVCLERHDGYRTSDSQPNKDGAVRNECTWRITLVGAIDGGMYRLMGKHDPSFFRVGMCKVSHQKWVARTDVGCSKHHLPVDGMEYRNQPTEPDGMKGSDAGFLSLDATPTRRLSGAMVGKSDGLVFGLPCFQRRPSPRLLLPARKIW